MTQTLDEKVNAVKSLLPMLTAHLDAHPGYRIVPRAQWVSEPGPATVPRAACDERCVGCTLHCPDEGWVTEYRRLRRAYPVIRRLERLLELRIKLVPGGEGRRWKAAISGIYLTPWDVMAHGEWPALAEAGVRWLAEQCDGDVPVFEGTVTMNRIRHTATGQEARDVRITELRIEGATYHRIAAIVGCSKSTVRAVLTGQKVRRGSTVAR